MKAGESGFLIFHCKAFYCRKYSLDVSHTEYVGIYIYIYIYHTIYIYVCVPEFTVRYVALSSFVIL